MRKSSKHSISKKPKSKKKASSLSRVLKVGIKLVFHRRRSESESRRCCCYRRKLRLNFLRRALHFHPKSVVRTPLIISIIKTAAAAEKKKKKKKQLRTDPANENQSLALDPSFFFSPSLACSVRRARSCTRYRDARKFYLRNNGNIHYFSWAG